MAKRKYRRFRVLPTGENPGVFNQGQGVVGATPSEGEQFTDMVLGLVDPEGPTRAPAGRYGPLGLEPAAEAPDYSASHAPAPPCGPSEFSHGPGMQPKVNASARRRAFESR